MSGERPREEIAKPYHKVWSELSMEQGCLLRGNRIVIPPKGYTAVIDLLHEGHPGETRMKTLGRSFMWWPGVMDIWKILSKSAISANEHGIPQPKLQFTHGSFQLLLGNSYMMMNLRDHSWVRCFW